MPWQTLAQDHTPKTLTGTLVESTLATVAVPGGTLGPNGLLRIWSLWSGNNSGTTKFPRLWFGGTLFNSIQVTSHLTVSIVLILRNRNVTNVQLVQPVQSAGFSQAGGPLITAAIDTSLSQNVLLAGVLASAPDILTLESYHVEVFPV